MTDETTELRERITRLEAKLEALTERFESFERSFNNDMKDYRSESADMFGAIRQDLVKLTTVVKGANGDNGVLSRLRDVEGQWRNLMPMVDSALEEHNQQVDSTVRPALAEIRGFRMWTWRLVLGAVTAASLGVGAKAVLGL